MILDLNTGINFLRLPFFSRSQIKQVSFYSLSRMCTRSKETSRPTDKRPNSTWTPLRQTWTTKWPVSTPRSTRPPPTSWPSWASPPDLASSADNHVTFRVLETNFFFTLEIFMMSYACTLWYCSAYFLSKYTF